MTIIGIEKETKTGEIITVEFAGSKNVLGGLIDLLGAGLKLARVIVEKNDKKNHGGASRPGKKVRTSGKRN